MIYTLDGITKDCFGRTQYILTDAHGNACVNVDFKLILRPLPSMTEEEKQEEIVATGGMFVHLPNEFDGRKRAAKGIAFLISKGFDLFGLIESGLAIENPVKR